MNKPKTFNKKGELETLEKQYKVPIKEILGILPPPFPNAYISVRNMVLNTPEIKYGIRKGRNGKKEHGNRYVVDLFSLAEYKFFSSFLKSILLIILTLGYL